MFLKFESFSTENSIVMRIVKKNDYCPKCGGVLMGGTCMYCKHF